MHSLALSMLLVAAATGEWDFTFEVPEGFLVEQNDSSWMLRSPDAEHLVTLQPGPWPDAAALEQDLAGSNLGCPLERPARGVVACAYESEVNGEKLPGYLVARASRRGGGVVVNVFSSPTTPKGAGKKLALKLLAGVKERPARTAGHGAPEARKESAKKARAAQVGVKVKGGERVVLTPFAHFEVPMGFSGGLVDEQTWIFAARDLAITWIFADGKPADEVARALAEPRPANGEILERVSGPERDETLIRIGHKSARFEADTWIMDFGARGALVLVAFSGAGESFRRGNAAVLFTKGLRPVKGGAATTKPDTVVATTTGARKGRKDWTRELAGKVAWYKSTVGGSSGGVDGLYVGSQFFRAYHFCSNGLVLLQNESVTLGGGAELSQAGALRGRWQVRQDKGAALVMQFEDGSAETKQLGNPAMAMLDQIPELVRGTGKEKEAEKILELTQGLMGMTSPMFSNYLELDLLPYETADSPLCN